MNKKNIIIIFVLLVTVSISGCINSSIDDINKIIPQLSQDIINGDNNYNDAVNYVNNRDYDTADEKTKLAITNFNNGQNKILEIDQYLENVNETIYIQYLNLVKEELSLKENATSNLQLAIQFFQAGNNETGNSYVSTANSLMDQAVIIQKERDALVQNYPAKFNT